MKYRTTLLVIGANLLALTALVFIYPHLMLAPGRLIAGHAPLEADCFACHQPFVGATAQRCIACHALAKIGRETTQGVPVVGQKIKTPFHQGLVQQDCMACHSDHADVRKYHAGARFSHELLAVAIRDRCGQCHARPSDTLHAKVAEDCGTCHGRERWKPASFEHGKYFLLDRDHNVTCVTCHLGSDYKRTTCYGCHEHTPAKMRAEHAEEGIRDLENCAKCHRNANKEDAKRAMRALGLGGGGEGE
jgi:hypothetical protein